MTEDLVKFQIPSDFVVPRVLLRPSELAYGYVNGWLDEQAVVRIAEHALGASEELPPPMGDLAILLSDELGRVPELISEIDDRTEEDPSGVWLYLALDWLHEHRDEQADSLQVVEMLYADFDYPAEIEGLIRFMPAPPGAQRGPGAIEERWRDYLRARSEEYAGRMA